MNVSKKFFSKIGFNYLILAFLTIIFEIIIVNILYSINSNFLNNNTLLSTMSAFCNYILPFPLFYLLMKKIDKVSIKKKKITLKTFITYLGISLTLMWIGNIIGLFVTELLSNVIQNDIANPVGQLINNSELWFNILIISVLGPIFEELFFRKFLIDRTIKHGTRLSILLSAVIFAFFHGNLNQFFYAFLIGGFLGYVYVKTGNIIYNMIIHLFINFMGSVLSLCFNNSLMNLQSSFNPLDVFIVISYFVIIVLLLIIGVIGILKFRKKIFKNVEVPLKSIFLNWGMLCFIAFFTTEIIMQILP